MDDVNEGLRPGLDDSSARGAQSPRHYTRLWIGLVTVIAASFAVLGYFGGELYRQAPPIPARVVTTSPA
jgi:nitric oxide reductase subunit B